MTMLLTVAEAATVLGCSPRAVRARLARGELKGRKQDGQWQIPRGDLPLSEEQHRALQARADAIREMVEDVLPPQLAERRGDHRRTLADLAAFRAGSTILAELRSAAAEGVAGTTAAAEHLERALVGLGRNRWGQDLLLATGCGGSGIRISQPLEQRGDRRLEVPQARPATPRSSPARTPR